MANVLNKTTMEYLTSVDTSLYLDGSWLINPDLSSVSGVPSKYWKIVGSDVVEMTQGEKDAVDAANLASLKLTRYAEIDSRTDELIAGGHTYGGKLFSLSSEAQRTFLGMYVSRADLTYPVTVNTDDDTDSVDLVDQTDVTNFYLNGIATVRAHLDSGTALKNQIRAAITKSEVDAVVDNR